MTDPDFDTKILVQPERSLPTVLARPARRGFGAMDPEKQRAIASMGGKMAHQKGTAHEFSPDEAKAAGRKGGQHAHGKKRMDLPKDCSLQDIVERIIEKFDDACADPETSSSNPQRDRDEAITLLRIIAPPAKGKTKVVKVKGAQAVTDAKVLAQGLMIVVDEPLDAETDPGWIDRSRRRFAQEGQRLADALAAALPGGTLDALLVALLRRRASLLVVPLILGDAPGSSALKDPDLAEEETLP